MSIRFVLRGVARGALAPGLAPVALLLCLGTAAGCSGLRETVEVRSVPEGAFVYVNGSFAGNTPADLRLKRQIPHRMEFRKVGYRTREVRVNPEYESGTKPSVSFGALESMGAYVTLRPNPVEVELVHEMVPQRPETGNREAYGEHLREVEEAVAAGDLTGDEAVLVREQLREVFFPEGLPPEDS